MTCPSCGRENPPGFAFCGYCGTALAEGPGSPAEERKVVTVLFCDLVGFTARSDRADPEDVKATLRPFHARLKHQIELFGGTLDKFIGDAALGVFGSPVAHEDDPERAVRSALAILDELTEMNERRPDLGLAVRIGVNTGEAVVAYGFGPQIGEAVTGDVVNTASRLQAVAPPGGVVVGEATHRATRNVFVYEDLEPVRVKGKADPLRIWRAVRARGRFGPEFTRLQTGPFVGRGDELTILREAFDRTRTERSARLVTLIGEPGIGKSRLVAELSRHADALPDLVTWRQGRCLPYGEGVTFWALGEIMKAHAGILDSDRAEVAAAKLDAVVPAGEPDRSWLIQRVAPLVGGGTGAPAERDESFTAWRRFLETMGANRPTVIVVEDVHWADPALLDFVEHVAATSRGLPLLLVCTARPELRERHPGWPDAVARAVVVELPPLSDADTARLLGGLLDQAALPTDVEALLIDRAGGNPLYAEEFVRMLRDEGFLAPSGGTWQLVDGAEIAFPDSVQSLIAARLDTLSQERKAVLQDASVVGKVFWERAVASTGGRGDATVASALEELGGRELVRPQPISSFAGEREYAFLHAIVRDVCYGQIPRAARGEKHRLAARWIEEAARDRVEDLAGVLAHHYATALELARVSHRTAVAADLEEPARRFLAMAGDRSLGLDVARAETYYERALELAPAGHPDRPGLLARWADAVRQSGRFAEASAALEEAIAALAARGERLAAARAMGTLSSVFVSTGNPRQEAVAMEAVRLLEAEPPGPELVAAYARMAGVQVVLGAPRAVVEWVDRAEELAVRVGARVPARALGFRGYARCSLGDAAGLGDMRAALALAVERGEARDAAVLHNNLAVAISPVEGPAGALAACREGIAFAERRGILELAVAMRAASLDALVDTGLWDEALALAETITAQAEESGDVADLLQARWAEARVLAARGDRSRAGPLAEWLLGAVVDSGAGAEDVAAGFTAAALAFHAADRPDRAHDLLERIDAAPHVREGPTYPAHLPAMVRLAARLGDVALAERLAGGVEPVFPHHEHALVAAGAVIGEARGDLEAAAAAYADAAGRWERFGVVPERAAALLGLGRTLLALDRRKEAAAPIREAESIFDRLGARRDRDEAAALLGPSTR